MNPLAQLVAAVVAFVASHELLSHPLRAPLVRAVGEKGFALVYSVFAFVTLGWAMWAWRSTPADQLWVAPGWVGALALVAMLFAAILFVGSVSAPNPALMGGKTGSGPQGVQRITRHPMMWAFAIWAIVHMVMSGDSRTLVLAGGILVLALFGASMQDRKKRGQVAGYGAHEAATGFVPFGAQAGGRAAWSSARPGWIAAIGGLVLWVLLLWAHPMVIGVSPIRIG